LKKKINTKLVGQVGEHLLSAKLGMMGFYASPYAGNVPAFDVTAVNATTLESFVLQVKASTTDTLIQSEINKWIETQVDDTGLYRFGSEIPLNNPDMIWVAINLPNENLSHARFFLCNERDSQEAHINRFVNWIKSHGYRRPKRGKSMQSILTISDLSKFEDNWSILYR